MNVVGPRPVDGLEVCCRLRLDPSDESTGTARRAVSAEFGALGLDRQAVSDAELVTSELVANAVHAAAPGGRVELRLGAGPGRVRIEVDDDGPGLPASRPGSERGGFGLQVVEALSRRWGTVMGGPSKTVWAELATPLGGERTPGP